MKTLEIILLMISFILIFLSLFIYKSALREIKFKDFLISRYSEEADRLKEKLNSYKKISENIIRKNNDLIIKILNDLTFVEFKDYIEVSSKKTTDHIIKLFEDAGFKGKADLVKKIIKKEI